MKTEIKEVPFNGKTLLGVKTEDGNIWLAIRKASIDIGLNGNQADNEVKKVKKNLLFNNNWKELSVKYDGQVRTIFVLIERFVPMWLAQIHLTPSMLNKNPEATGVLLKYQLEATDVLHKAFYETSEQKEALHTSLGLEGQIMEMKEIQKTQTVQINRMEETIDKQLEILSCVMDNMTLSTRQQQKIYKAGKDRIGALLGGAHSMEYKENAKSYFINMWNGLKALYGCASYRDLNPKYFDVAFDYVSEWKYR
jgi:hypothetical protein